MAQPVQAGSLASVIDLADNPPHQPLQSLTRELQQPLVLYIARVPGSHDVFLTTMKPQQKVVTAQDVQSSLYYLHLDKPEDCELLDSVGEPNGLSDDEDAQVQPANTGIDGVRRKPLPPRPMLGSGDRRESSPEVRSSLQSCSNGPSSSPQVKRESFSQDIVAAHRHMDVGPPLPDRKLLGPRPMHQRFLSLDDSPLQAVPEKQNIDLRRWSEQPVGTPPKLPPRRSSGNKSSAPMAYARPLEASLKDTSVANGGHSKFLGRTPVAQIGPHGMNSDSKDGSNAQEIRDASLSLIRRYDNEQWNVGKISSKSTKTTIGEFGESGCEISIQIMTQGYLKFTDPINSFAKKAVPVSQNSNGSRDSNSPVTATEKQVYFHRRLQVSGHSVGRSKRRRPESTDSTFIDQGTRPSFDLPRLSHQSSDSAESHRSLMNGTSELTSESKQSNILESPWGVCEFMTGVVGRSFRCKHSYKSSDPRFGPGMRTAQVSELRFNLPSSKTFGSTGSKSIVPGTPREAKRSSQFLHQRRGHSSSSFEGKDTHGKGYVAPPVELEERLDLTLGQEHAGGGFGGKQAKMGKLIIENEGLQMLDLIVAANMALWWRVYERFT